MKKIILLIMAFVCFYIITGCGDRKEADEIILTKPPALTISCGESEVSAKTGTHRWEFINEAGINQAYVSDFPKASIDDMPKVLYRILPPSSSESWDMAHLHFETLPSEVEIRCLSIDDYQNNPDRYENISVENFSFKLKDGQHIYQVFAKWEEDKLYKGECYYCFYGEMPVKL